VAGNWLVTFKNRDWSYRFSGERTVCFRLRARAEGFLSWIGTGGQWGTVADRVSDRSREFGFRVRQAGNAAFVGWATARERLALGNSLRNLNCRRSGADRAGLGVARLQAVRSSRNHYSRGGAPFVTGLRRASLLVGI